MGHPVGRWGWGRAEERMGTVSIMQCERGVCVGGSGGGGAGLIYLDSEHKMKQV